MPDLRSDFEQLLFLADAYSRDAVNKFNYCLSGLTPIEIVILTIAAIIVARTFAETISVWRKTGIKTMLFRFAIKLPIVKGKVQKQLDDMKRDFKEQYGKQRPQTFKELPEKGWQVSKIMDHIKVGEKDSRVCWAEHKISGAVYTDDQKHWDFLNDVMNRFVQTNPLHMDEYKMVTRMEAEVIR